MAETNRLLYVIHAAHDHSLAKFLKTEIEAQIPNWHVFVASKAGEIPTGSEWLSEIHDKLGIASWYLVGRRPDTSSPMISVSSLMTRLRTRLRILR